MSTKFIEAIRVVKFTLCSFSARVEAKSDYLVYVLTTENGIIY